MKTDYEMYQNVLSRFNEHQRKKKRRITMIKRTISFAACFAVIFSGYRIWSDIPRIQQPPVIEDSSTNEKEPSTQNSSTQTTTVLQTSGQDKNIVTKATEDNSNLAVTTNSEETKVITSAATEINTMPRVEVVNTVPPSDVSLQFTTIVTKKTDVSEKTTQAVTTKNNVTTPDQVTEITSVPAIASTETPTIITTQAATIPAITYPVTSMQTTVSNDVSVIITTQAATIPAIIYPETQQTTQSTLPENEQSQISTTITTTTQESWMGYMFLFDGDTYKSENIIGFVERVESSLFLDVTDLKYIDSNGLKIYYDSEIYLIAFDSDSMTVVVHTTDDEEDSDYYIKMKAYKMR